MPIARVKFPDGRIGKFKVGEGFTPSQVLEYVSANFSSYIPNTTEDNNSLGSEPIDSPNEPIKQTEIPIEAESVEPSIIEPKEQTTDLYDGAIDVLDYGNTTPQPAIKEVQPIPIEPKEKTTDLYGGYVDELDYGVEQSIEDKQYKEDNPNYLKEGASDMLHTILPIGSSIIGGIGGSIASPIGAIAGGTVGYAGGEQLADWLDQHMGLTSPMTMKEGAKDIGKDLAIGLAGELIPIAAIKLIKKAGKPIWDFAKSYIPMEKLTKTTIGGKLVAITDNGILTAEKADGEELMRAIPGLKLTSGEVALNPQLLRMQKKALKTNDSAVARKLMELKESNSLAIKEHSKKFKDIPNKNSFISNLDDANTLAKEELIKLSETSKGAKETLRPKNTIANTGKILRRQASAAETSFQGMGEYGHKPLDYLKNTGALGEFKVTDRGVAGTFFKRGKIGTSDGSKATSAAKKFNAFLKDDPKATSALKNHVLHKMAKDIGDPMGNVVPDAMSKWAKSHGAALKELGLIDDIMSPTRQINIANEARKARQVYLQTTLGKMLKKNPDDVISSIFTDSTSSKQIKAVNKVFDDLKGNKEALNTLQTLFTEHLIKASKANVNGSKLINLKEFDGLVKRYEPTIKTLFKNDPKKKFAFKNYRDAIERLQATNNIKFTTLPKPQEMSMKEKIGGLATDVLKRYGKSKTLNVLAGYSLGGPTGVVGGIVTSLMNEATEKQATAIMNKALFDPEYATALMKLVKPHVSDATKKNIVKRLVFAQKVTQVGIDKATDNNKKADVETNKWLKEYNKRNQ